ncbi:hypothetical protein YYC_00064 [Plasmodium yoelii 17X]|uniref:Uncharacterized protein n=1 Tax=Plasmodium yoelii 17X TaxID=1323249 RepID=V7PVR4_PLAYE|nr:hypothetical protein YYC_00064 [Plasmodium yoelii 17X]
MNKEVCEKFENIWEAFPDELNSSGEYKFKDTNFLNSHCDGNTCDNDIEKISAGFFYLLSGFFGGSDLFNFDEKSKNDIFYYIMIWLSYMLNLKENESNDSLKYFYDKDIKIHQKYTNPIAGFSKYNSYKDLLDGKKIVNMDIKAISKFYAPFKSLCNMYYEFNGNNKKCKKYLDDDNEFFKKYKELKNDSDITDRSPYKEILSALSTDYNKLKNECNKISSSQPKGTEQILVQSSVDTSSSSSIGNKLISVLSVFGAIAFFLGISYKFLCCGTHVRVRVKYYIVLIFYNLNTN